MKKTLYTPLLTAALLLAASCANDPVEEILNPSVPGTHLPGDTFIIDYAASTGEADTRADANQRIQSLDYLVYQSTDGGTTYTLLKRRAIPDINSTTKWPLTRGTMTWAQREALKDTLNTSCMYKMVFVANAADWIWEPENPNPPSNDALKNSSDIVLLNANLPTDGTEAPTFDEGRLILPPRVFTEKDMYYMWSNHDAPVNGADFANGDKIHYMDITLKRMINKVEVKLDEEVVQAISNTTITDYEEYKTKVDEYKTEILSAYYDTYYADTKNKTGELYDQVSAYLLNFYDKLEIENWETDILPRGRDKRLFKNTYLGETGRDNLIADINLCNDENQNCVKEEFIQNTKSLLQCNWKDVDYINVKYTANSYPQSIDFSRKTWASTTEGIIKGKANTDYEFSYIFYAFGNNEANETVLNKIQSIEFVRSDNVAETFEINNIGIIPNGKTIQGNNEFELTYNPTSTENIQIETIDSENNDTYFSFERENFTLMTLGWEWADFEINQEQWDQWDQNNMEDWLNKGLEDAGINGTWQSMTLSLDIPMIKIINAWEIVE